MKINVGNDLYLKGRIGWKGLSKDEYLEESKYRIINGYSLREGYIDWDIAGYISEDRYEESPEIKLEIGDILISKDGTIGKVGIVRELLSPSTVASGIFVLRNIIHEKLDTEYLFQYLNSNNFKNFINLVKADGSTINHLYQRDLVRLEIDVPELILQKKIAKVLSDLDAKIELNNKINSELESIAKLIYDYWFVQFDFPDENGKPYKSSGGEMVYNEELKREIPEGWEVKELRDRVNIYDSLRVPLSKSEREKMIGTIPYYGATSVMGYVNDYLFDDDYILLAEDGSVMDEKGMPIVQFIWGKTWVNNHAHVIQAVNKLQNEFIFQLVKMIPVVLIKTGSIQMKINQENLKNYKVIVPPEKLVNEYSIKANSIRRKLINSHEQNKSLSELRDWLLPMLMNGQVTVN